MIVDRLVRGKDAPQRRLDSIETAFARGLGRCGLLLESGTRTFVRGWRCSQCGTDHLEPEINLFRFNSSLGACPRCEGSGWGIELDLDRIIPDRSMVDPQRGDCTVVHTGPRTIAPGLAAIVQQAWRPDRRAIQSAHA